MNNKYEVVIGIENHVQIKTKTKMFSPGPVSYNETPNSQVNVMDIGYPGVLPSVNKQGVKLAILACHLLHMAVASKLYFDRKNYYYTDLSKGFQITQHFNPIGTNGYLIIPVNGHPYRVAIERIQIEEDTAKQIHNSQETLLDYNRSGIGLLEVITEPVLSSAEAAVIYITALRDKLVFAKITSGKMNEGAFRSDVNISVRLTGTTVLNNKVEIKNLNSLANIKKAIGFEIQRQIAIMEVNGEVHQTTRRFDEATQQTVLMRNKESDIDYKFFTEPNIQPIILEDQWINHIKNTAPLTRQAATDKLVNEFQLPVKQVNVLLNNFALWEMFKKVVPNIKNYAMLLNYLIGDVSSYLKNTQITLGKTQLTNVQLGLLINQITNDNFSSKQGKFILQKMLSEPLTMNQIIDKYRIVYLNDPGVLKQLITTIISQQKNFIEVNHERPDRIIKFLTGQVMKQTQGNASPIIVNQLLKTAVFKK